MQNDQKQAVQKLRRVTVVLAMAVFILVIFLILRYRPAAVEAPLQKGREIPLSDMQKADFNMEEALEIGRQEVATSSVAKSEAVAGGKNLSDTAVIYGFLPYWQASDNQATMAGKLNLPSQMTNVAYFGLGMDETGQLLTDEEEIAANRFGNGLWREEVKEWQASGINRNLEIVIFVNDKETLDTVLLNEEAIDRLVMNLHRFLGQNSDVKGINLDFEYFATPSEAVREGMSLFLAKLKKLRDEYHPQVRISIDVFGKMGERQVGIYDWSKAAEYVDYVILMGYDYKTRGSSLPGPVSPTLGASKWGGNDVFNSLRVLAKKIPHYQIILGVPFYGYGWEVTNFDLEEKTSRTYPETGRTVTYEQARAILNWSAAQKKEWQLTEGWDEASLTPYLMYEEPVTAGQGSGGSDHKRVIIFYENPRSLKYKLDLVKGMNLGGIAVWALGYEGADTEMWEQIQTIY